MKDDNREFIEAMSTIIDGIKPFKTAVVIKQEYVEKNKDKDLKSLLAAGFPEELEDDLTEYRITSDEYEMDKANVTLYNAIRDIPRERRGGVRLV